MSNVFPTNTVNPLLRMHNKGNYWFFHKDSYPTDNPLLLNELIKNANTYIEIFDPYFKVTGLRSDQDIFNDISNDVTLKMITLNNRNINNYKRDVLNAVRTKITSSKNVRFGMRIIDENASADSGFVFHDRFLIIDQKDVYLVGSSIDYYLTPRKSSGIYKIDDTNTINFIQEIYTTYWNKGISNEIPIQFL